MERLTVCWTVVSVLREIGMQARADTLAEERAMESARQSPAQTQNPGLTWNDFDRDSLQPQSTTLRTAALVLSAGLFVAVGGTAGILCLIQKYDLALTTAYGLVPLGVLIINLYSYRDRLIQQNRENTDLIRRLDAGVYIPRPVQMEGTGGGS